MKTIIFTKNRSTLLILLTITLYMTWGCSINSNQINQLNDAIQKAQTTADAAYSLAVKAQSNCQQATTDAIVAEDIAIKTQNATDDVISCIKDIEERCCNEAQMADDE